MLALKDSPFFSTFSPDTIEVQKYSLGCHMIQLLICGHLDVSVQSSSLVSQSFLVIQSMTSFQESLNFLGFHPSIWFRNVEIETSTSTFVSRHSNLDLRHSRSFSIQLESDLKYLRSTFSFVPLMTWRLNSFRRSQWWSMKRLSVKEGRLILLIFNPKYLKVKLTQWMPL